jgi:SAM-dependent methyltransferase
LTWYREWFGEEYLDLYAYRDEAEARQHVTFFKQQVGSVRGRMLDLACGNGRHLQELRSEGYDAVGCDLSYVLLRTAAEGAGSLPLIRADMRRLPFCDSSFHGLVNFFTSFGYFENEDDNAAVVSEMCRVLTKGSPFLFDFMNVHRELSQLVQREEREVDGNKVQIERWFDPAARTFNKRISMSGRRFIERVRGYDLDEISTLFAAGGLAIREVFGDFDGAPFDRESPRLIVIGVRRK